MLYMCENSMYVYSWIRTKDMMNLKKYIVTQFNIHPIQSSILE